MSELDSMSNEFGFTDHAELVDLVAKVDLSTTAKVEAFMDWRDTDGSKAGLLKLLADPKGD